MSKKGLFVVKSPVGKIVKAEAMDRDTNTFDNKMTERPPAIFLTRVPTSPPKCPPLARVSPFRKDRGTGRTRN